MNMDEFLDQNLQAAQPAAEQDTVFEASLKQFNQALVQNDTQQMLQTFLRLHDAIMREHENEHNPAHHQALANAKQQLFSAIQKTKQSALVSVSSIKAACAQSLQELNAGNVSAGVKTLELAKASLAKFPTGFEQLRQDVQQEVNRVHDIAQVKLIVVRNKIHQQIVEQMKDAMQKCDVALTQNQIAQANALAKKVHELYAQLPAGFIEEQLTIVHALIALDYQVKMKTTLTELSSYAQMYQIKDGLATAQSLTLPQTAVQVTAEQNIEKPQGASQKTVEPQKPTPQQPNPKPVQPAQAPQQKVPTIQKPVQQPQPVQAQSQQSAQKPVPQTMPELPKPIDLQLNKPAQVAPAKPEPTSAQSELAQKREQLERKAKELMAKLGKVKQ